MWTDSPISSSVDDEFGRKAYAAHAAELVASTHSWEDSVVFGLTGPWGSGKSSMLAMITEALKQAHPEWCVAQFTPWATGDVAGLLGDFYSTLSNVLPTHHGKQVRQALGTLLQVAAPAAGAVPWAGGAIGAAARSGGAALKKQTPWDVAFKAAADELQKLKTPVLLIADDIDRLQTEELLLLLKVVRLLGRFPGVDYLLAYDEATLFQALSEANLVGHDDGGAGRFMEKIVQYPLVVPPLLSAQLLTRLDEGLDAAFAEAGRPQLTSRRLGHLKTVFRSLLATPRAIDRFLAQLRHHLPLVAESEINDEDVVVLTLLRTAYPTLYQQLPRWKEQLLSGHTGEIKSYHPIEYQLFDPDLLLSSLPGLTRPDAKTLLIDLFPKLKSDGMSYGHRNRGISHSRYFDRYFAMGIPAHDISDVEVAEAVEAASLSEGQALKAMLVGISADRVTLVVEKARQETDGYPTNLEADAKRLALARLLLELYEKVVDKKSFFFSPRERVMGWAAKLLSGLSQHAVADQVNEALQGTNSLTQRLHVVYEAIDTDEELTGWAVQTVPDLTLQAAQAFVANLQAGDEAGDNDAPGWMAHFVLTFGKVDDLAKVIAQGLIMSEFTVADVASRFVKLRLMSGAADWELGDFDQDSFNKLVPATPDPWFESPKAEVDRFDVSWANRKAYAAGRAKQPSD